MFYPLWDWDATCAALFKVFSLIPCKAWMMEKGAYFLRLGSLNNSTEREALLEWPLELLPYIHEGNLKKMEHFCFPNLHIRFIRIASRRNILWGHDRSCAMVPGGSLWLYCNGPRWERCCRNFARETHPLRADVFS